MCVKVKCGGRILPRNTKEDQKYMFVIEKSLQKINGEILETFRREVNRIGTSLEVEAGTTGYRGGCHRKAGSRTFLSLLCLSGDFYFEPIKDEAGKVTGITVACCGDDGLDALMKALEFVYAAIDDQRCDVAD